MALDFVFLHGGGQGSWVWRDTIAALATEARGDHDHGRILALDVPGCGSKRDRATEGMTLEHVAAELVADIKAADLTEVVLVGHSQAGQAICLMLRLSPDLFRRIVYISCSIPLPGQNVQQMIGSGLQGENPDEVGWPLDPATTPAADRYREMFCNDMSPEQGNAFLAKLGRDRWPMSSYSHTDWPGDHLGRVPASFVLCLKDRSLPEQWQRVFADRFKTEHLVRVDAGHQVMNTRPWTLAEILMREAAR